jgi:hypothetical protein
MGDLKGKIDVVSRVCRGASKDIAIALGEQGCIVWLTGTHHRPTLRVPEQTNRTYRSTK